MGDIKNIRVDNWGMFFLQRLQQFFNKTDYCDLTLQFHDNSQLKVHRLVLNACTEYFTILERNCEMIDDCLIMPMDLQADVVVPIVNFMYTGQLEFRYNMLDRLQTTAQIMNIAILTKLLRAQRIQAPNASKPVLLNHQNPIVSMTYNLQGRNIIQKVDEYSNARNMKRRPMTYGLDNITPEPLRVTKPKFSNIVDNVPRPTRFEATEVVSDNTFETSFDSISYESKPLSMPKLDNNSIESKNSNSNNPFEELRKGYVQKRPAPASPTSSEPKRVNLQDVKEYVEAHRLRANYEVEENEDDPDDDNYHDNGNDDYDSGQEEDPNSNSQEISTESSNQALQNIKTEQQKIISVSQDSSANHARIISEVLKKYPHIMKNNKNIKLKVVQQRSSGTTKLNNDDKVVVSVAKECSPNNDGKVITHKIITPSGQIKVEEQPKVIDAKKMHALLALGAENKTGPWLCLRCGTNGRPISFPSYPVFRKHLVRVHNEKIDVRICEHCGHKSTKRNYLYFHLYTKHGIKPPSNTHFPKCSHCDYIALNDALLSKHILNHSKLNEFVCNQCSTWFRTKQALISHMAQTGHKIGATTKESQQCIYCNKMFLREANMYAHVKSVHKEQARNDGIIEFSDNEEKNYTEPSMETVEGNDKYIPNDPQLQQRGKIKILSNIALPPAVSKEVQMMLASGHQTHVNTISQNATIGSQIVGSDIIIQNAVVQSLEPSSEAEALNNVASGIATSLGLVDSIVVMDDHYEISNQNVDENQDNTQFLVNQMQLDEISEEHISETMSEHSLVHSNESSLGQVQAEIQTGFTTTKIITQGNVLKLTESQQNEIINELQNSNHLTSQNNVVMVLTEDQFKQVKEHQMQNDENIYVVYSQASHIDVNEKQYLQIGESEELLEENTELCNSINQETIENNIAVQNEASGQWPEETVEMISEELRKQIQPDKVEDLVSTPLIVKDDENETQTFNLEQKVVQDSNETCMEGILQHDVSMESSEKNVDIVNEGHVAHIEQDVAESSIVTDYNEQWNEQEISKDIEENPQHCDMKQQMLDNADEIKQFTNDQISSDTITQNVEKEEVDPESEIPLPGDKNSAIVNSSDPSKISKLLDDWDETDSAEKALETEGQSQEHLGTTNDQIHKLMDDWTEEDTAMEM